MQVTITLGSIQENPDYEGGYIAIYMIETPDEARALASRIGLPMLIELPDAKPPDIYEVRIPMEEARTNESKGRRK